MTLVDIYQTVPDGEVGDPESPAIGYQTWEPTGPGARRRANAPAREVLPAPFRVDLLSTGVTTIEVAPTGETWAWFVSEYVDGILPTSRTIAIPDIDRIDFRDCPQIDPKTLDPIISSPSPVWVQQLAELTDEIASAQGHEDAAKLAAEQAAGSAFSAADSAQSAANSALSASGSAGTASTKASEATTSANTATAKANESTTSAATAITKANEAANSATASANSLAAASTKANEAANSATSAANSASTATTKANEAVAAAATATDKANSMSAYTASDVLTKLKTVGGVGSELDADLLDGRDSTDFVDLSGTQTITGSKTFSAPVSVKSIAIGAIHELSGIGMPAGVVSAPPGSYYTDTAGTNGAWRWIKKSGTGNTGWDVVHGDTGWRDVTASAINHPGIESGTIQIRRVVEVSFIRLYSLQFSSDYTTAIGPLINLPSGFAFGPISGLAARSNGLLYTVHIALTQWGQLYILKRGHPETPERVIPAGWPLSGMLSGPATQAWPTTLPGIPT